MRKGVVIEAYHLAEGVKVLQMTQNEDIGSPYLISLPLLKEVSTMLKGMGCKIVNSTSSPRFLVVQTQEMFYSISGGNLKIHTVMERG